mmetsp:Transcript_11891/g.36251  ORF Transcript_11891/g.36251 Transcript_11891/m.36251 type:complete len:269 (-) Transcript_11891:1622-2428(-)
MQRLQSLEVARAVRRFQGELKATSAGRGSPTTALKNVGRAVHISHLPEDMKREKLREFCQQFGTIDGTATVKSFAGEMTRTAVVVFKEEAAAESAVQNLNKMQLCGRDIVARKSYLQQTFLELWRKPPATKNVSVSPGRSLEKQIALSREEEDRAMRFFADAARRDIVLSQQHFTRQALKKSNEPIFSSEGGFSNLTVHSLPVPQERTLKQNLSYRKPKEIMPQPEDLDVQAILFDDSVLDEVRSEDGTEIGSVEESTFTASPSSKEH